MPRAIREPRAMRADRVGDTRRSARKAFTLVELLVVVVIVMALAAITLAGMATARKGAKIDRTRNTIRKIHEIVMPQYESYLRRRAPATVLSTAPAADRLRWVRHLLTFEMPDSWNDVVPNPLAVAALPSWLQTGPVYAYAAAKSAGPSGDYAGAECLYLIASRGPGDTEAMERFRTEEIGDFDKDGAPEFHDAWGRPIAFMRWAPGFSSPAQSIGAAAVSTFHDPFDPQQVDTAAYALVPLVVSAGPDGKLGLVEPPTTGWSFFLSPSPPGLIPIVGRVNPQPGEANNIGAAADNITNHDFSKK